MSIDRDSFSVTSLLPRDDCKVRLLRVGSPDFCGLQGVIGLIDGLFAAN